MLDLAYLECFLLLLRQYGMDEKFGPILLDGTNEGDMFQQKYYSDATGKEVALPP